MSVRIAADSEDETKPSAENKMIGIASMHVHLRKVWMSGSTRLPFDALRLSAVTGLSLAASVPSAASNLAAPGSFHLGLAAALALSMLVWVVSSTSVPVSAACVSNSMASSTTCPKSGIANGADETRSPWVSRADWSEVISTVVETAFVSGIGVSAG